MGEAALARAGAWANLLNPTGALLAAIFLGGVAWGTSTWQISNLATQQAELAAKVDKLAEAVLPAVADIRNNRERLVSLEAWRDRTRK